MHAQHTESADVLASVERMGRKEEISVQLRALLDRHHVTPNDLQKATKGQPDPLYAPTVQRILDGDLATEPKRSTLERIATQLGEEFGAAFPSTGEVPGIAHQGRWYHSLDFALATGLLPELTTAEARSLVEMGAPLATDPGPVFWTTNLAFIRLAKPDAPHLPEGAYAREATVDLPVEIAKLRLEFLPRSQALRPGVDAAVKFGIDHGSGKGEGPSTPSATATKSPPKTKSGSGDERRQRSAVKPRHPRP